MLLAPTTGKSIGSIHIIRGFLWTAEINPFKHLNWSDLEQAAPDRRVLYGEPFPVLPDSKASPDALLIRKVCDTEARPV
jgi:hypothetical protein